MDLGLEQWFEDRVILDDVGSWESTVFGFVSDRSESLDSLSKRVRVRSVLVTYSRGALLP